MKEISPDCSCYPNDILTSDLPVTSLHHRCNLTLVSNVCEAALRSLFCAPKTDSEFPFNLIGKSTKPFLKGQLLPVLKSWYTGEGPKKGFSRCFTDRLNQSLVSSKQQVTCYLSKLFLSAFYFVCFPFYFKFSAGTSQKTNQYRW